MGMAVYSRGNSGLTLSETTDIPRQGPETARLLREALVQEGRRAVVTVSSGSMEPTLRAGDRVTVDATRPSRLRRGDIVVFESPLDGLVVHRLIWTVPMIGEPRALYTKGDALSYLDRPIAAASCVGRVVAIERGGTRRRLRRTAGFISWMKAAAVWTARRILAGPRRAALIPRR